jgi:hypothetical protein
MTHIDKRPLRRTEGVMTFAQADTKEKKIKKE